MNRRRAGAPPGGERRGVALISRRAAPRRIAERRLQSQRPQMQALALNAAIDSQRTLEPDLAIAQGNISPAGPFVTRFGAMAAFGPVGVGASSVESAG